MQFFSKVFSANTCSGYSLNTACFNVDVQPMDKESYKSAVDVAELGSLTLSLVNSRSSIVTRKAENPNSPGARRYTIMYAVDGEMMIANNLGTSILKRGQFILIDNCLPRKMFVYKNVKLLLVCVERKLLQQHIPMLDEVVAQILPEPLMSEDRPLFSPILALWENLKHGDLEEFATSLGEELLNDIGKAYLQHDQSRQRSRHVLRLTLRIKQYIEANLANSKLSAETIAAEFQISTRYLRSLFQGGEKITHYIQRRRIEESARLLSSPQHRASTITDIAYLCGFNSSTHFARCFRSQFNETARHFRSRHMQMENASLNP
ncbi:MAG TPA: helix-turn-helix transcriptional regulator [Pseudomonadaceae bacterium]|nr:helix-turn-helix transcriptional regulator [Pseudomonadaceae bacterium]